LRLGLAVGPNATQFHPYEAESLTWLCSVNMGKITVKMKVTNNDDVVVKELNLSKRKPRALVVEALVDTGATRLYLQNGVIKKLGLRPRHEVISRTTNGSRRRMVYGPVVLEVMGRNGIFEVVEVENDVPNLLGQLPLEHLDFVVHPRSRKLMPNPEHGGVQMTEEFFQAQGQRRLVGAFSEPHTNAEVNRRICSSMTDAHHGQPAVQSSFL